MSTIKDENRISKSLTVKPLIVKLIIIGDSGVGKSCYLLKYTEDKFVPTFITTIGIDFRVKTIYIDGVACKLQIWDTAGQERFNVLTKAYYRNAHGVIIMFDVNDPISFGNVERWMNNFVNDPIPKILISNKIDLPNKITHEEALEVSTKLDCKLFELSVKESKHEDIEEPIKYLVSLIYPTLINKIETEDKIIKPVETKNNENQNSCC